MTQYVAELRDVLEKGGTNWFGYKEVSVAVKRLDEMIKDERYDRIPDLMHKIESAIYKAVPKLKPGTVEKRTGYTKVKARLLELVNPSDKTKGNSSYDELTILIERVQQLAHSLWENDHQSDASIAPSRKNLLQTLDYMEQRISETGRVLRRMDRLRKELISIHNTLRMIKVKPRQRIIAEREEIKDSDTLEQICASLMKLSDSVVDSSTQENTESPRQREREANVGQIEKNDLQHMQEWVSWLELSTKVDRKEKTMKKPLSHSDKRLMHHVHTSENVASMEKVIRNSSDTIIRLTQELEAANISNQQLEDRLSTTIKELQNENIDLIKQKDKNKKGVITKRRPSLIGNDREEVQKQIDKLIQEKKKLTNDLREAIKQKEHWMNKFSNITGAKPLAENTSVVDFDDPSRPQNIALRFGELFDNQWKQSLKIVVAKDPTQQKDAILQLATILKLSYQHCVQISSQQLRKLSDALFNLKEGNPDQIQQKNGNTAIPEEKIQVIRHVQKLSAPNTKEYVLKSFHEKLKKNKMELTLEEIPQYLKECIEICWYMTINNPQLVFIWPDEDGKENVTIDLEQFTYYTVVGDVIDYVVWPAMLKENGGSLLRKGVVEPVEKN